MISVFLGNTGKQFSAIRCVSFSLSDNCRLCNVSCGRMGDWRKTFFLHFMGTKNWSVDPL